MVPRTRDLTVWIVALWTIARPALWLVSLVPYYVGNLLATRELVPGTCHAAAPCWTALRPGLTGVLVMGPLAWLAVLAVNDAYDLPGDLRNPRKKGSPLTSGRLSAHAALVAAYSTAAFALAVATTVRPGFVYVTAGFLVLGWLYSVPPLRLKDRPGYDVAANAIAVGALAPLAGWAVARPLGGFPPMVAVQGILVTIALYIPTTLADYDTDAATGETTIAVRLGRHPAYLIGFTAWTLSCLGAITLAATGHVLPHRTLWIQLLCAPILITAYHHLLSTAHNTAQIVRGLTIISWLFLIPSTTFALTYTGWL